MLPKLLLLLLFLPLLLLRRLFLWREIFVAEMRVDVAKISGFFFKCSGASSANRTRQFLFESLKIDFGR